jgi:hypothetical protein
MQAAGSDPALGRLAERIAALHAMPADDTTIAELGVVVQRARLDALERELESLTAVAAPSPDQFEAIRRTRAAANAIKIHLATQTITSTS